MSKNEVAATDTDFACPPQRLVLPESKEVTPSCADSTRSGCTEGVSKAEPCRYPPPSDEDRSIR